MAACVGVAFAVLEHAVDVVVAFVVPVMITIAAMATAFLSVGFLLYFVAIFGVDGHADGGVDDVENEEGDEDEDDFHGV